MDLVLKANKLEALHLEKLFTGDVLVVRIQNFYDTSASDLVAEKLIRSELFGQYENAPNIGRVGQAFFENSPEARERYERDAVKWIQDTRYLCAPYLTPIDKLRLELDEILFEGAALGRHNGRHMYVGLARVLMDGAAIYPHQDHFHRDIERFKTTTVRTQVACNIYIKPSISGGALQIWANSLSDEDYEAMKDPNGYGISRDKLPPPDVTIYPEKGELVLFNANNLHAVTESEGVRVSVSCFVGYAGHDRPCPMWS